VSVWVLQKKGGFLTTAQISEGLKWSETRIKGAWSYHNYVRACGQRDSLL
jgi:hypothetical protein